MAIKYLDVKRIRGSSTADPVARQGYDGGVAGDNWASAGGGGAGQVGGNGANGASGANGGVGGDGLANPIAGSVSGVISSGVYYLAGGGGGSSSGGASNAAGGKGGGGTGSGGGGGGTTSAGATNSGSGGGGGTAYGSGSNGGSGIVILKYLTSEISATGGSETTTGSYTISTFTASGTFQITSGSGNVQYCVVAGGGGAGGNQGGGAGAGGLLTGTKSMTAASYTVTIGAGGTGSSGSGTNGANSVFDDITTIGGGAGHADGNSSVSSGGSGGGGSGASNAGGAGTAASSTDEKATLLDLAANEATGVVGTAFNPNGTIDRFDFQDPAVNGTASTQTVAYDIGAVQGNAWTLRMKVRYTTLIAGDSEIDVGLSDTNHTAGGNGNQDFVGVRLIAASGTAPNTLFRPRQCANDEPRQGADSSNYIGQAVDTDYYLQIQRTSGTAYSVRWTTNSNYTGGTYYSNGSGTNNITASGLRYIKLMNGENETYTNMTGQITELKFWNSTTTSGTPTLQPSFLDVVNIEENTLFEEIDTRTIYGLESTEWKQWYPVPLRAVIAGGTQSDLTAGNRIEYFSISTRGNATTWGANLTVARAGIGSGQCNNDLRAVFVGGET